jgi:hypothetical protein
MDYLERRKAYYQKMIDWGFPSAVAGRFKSLRQVKRIGKLIKRGLSPEQSLKEE